VSVFSTLRDYLRSLVRGDEAEAREPEKKAAPPVAKPVQRTSQGDGFDAGPRGRRVDLSGGLNAPLLELEEPPVDDSFIPPSSFNASLDDLPALVDEPLGEQPEFIPEGGMSTQSLMREFDVLDPSIVVAPPVEPVSTFFEAASLEESSFEPAPVPLEAPISSAAPPQSASPAPEFVSVPTVQFVDEPLEDQPEFIPEGGMSTQSLMRELELLDPSLVVAPPVEPVSSPEFAAAPAPPRQLAPEMTAAPAQPQRLTPGLTAPPAQPQQLAPEATAAPAQPQQRAPEMTAAPAQPQQLTHGMTAAPAQPQHFAPETTTASAQSHQLAPERTAAHAQHQQRAPEFAPPALPQHLAPEKTAAPAQPQHLAPETTAAPSQPQQLTPEMTAAPSQPQQLTPEMTAAPSQPQLLPVKPPTAPTPQPQVPPAAPAKAQDGGASSARFAPAWLIKPTTAAPKPTGPSAGSEFNASLDDLGLLPQEPASAAESPLPAPSGADDGQRE